MISKYKTQKENEDAARALPLETKKKFWSAMMQECMNVREARELAGIDDVMVATALVIQLHKTASYPMPVEDIT